MLKNIFLNVLIYIVLLSLYAFLYAGEPVLITIPFSESPDDFPNPERGFYKYNDNLRTITAPDVANLRAQNITLVYGRTLADDYTNKPLDVVFFNELQNGFNIIRNAGLKVNFRFTYYDDSNYTNYLDYDDPPKTLVIQHIHQLQPLFETNADIINLVEAGFIGPWGEWHSSSLANTVDRRDILTNLLSVLPASRMVAIRCPAYKRQIFGINPLNDITGFSGSYIARVGFHNDCFVSSEDDSGTYSFGWTRNEELDYTGNETRYTPFGGESCGLHAYSFCNNAVYEMKKLHMSYINDGYHPSVLNRWVTGGCMSNIKIGLGYRFVLKKIEISDKVRPGGILHIIFHITNVGFAAPFNQRDVELILDSGVEKLTTDIDSDPRTWLPQKNILLDKFFQIPINITETNYRVILNLPDPEPSIHDNPYYAIRLANKNIWEPSTGYNIIRTNLQITDSAGGNVFNNTNFTECYPYFITNVMVSDFQVSADKNGIHLSWQNPDFPTYSKTIIFKSNSGYISHPSNFANFIIYSGTGDAFTDQDILHNNWYYYTAYTKSIYTQYSNPVTNKILYQDTWAPSAPEQLFISRDDNQNIILLKWKKNSEFDLAGYYIFRKSASQNKFKKTLNKIYNKNIYKEVLPEENIYQYYIKAVDWTGNVSSPSKTVTIATRKYSILGEDKVKVAPNFINLNNNTSISVYFLLESDSNVEIKVYDTYSRIKKEYTGDYGKGIFEYSINCETFEPGIYILKVKSLEFKKTFKLGIIK